MVEQRPAMETNNPTLSLHQSDSLLDGEKTGAAWFFSGLFLALTGVTITAMCWQRYQVSSNFQWLHLLGPILFSIGGTFMLTSIWKFKIISCWPCRWQEEEVFVIPVREQTSRQRPVVVRGINQPVFLQGTTTMLCIPPAYNFVTREVNQENELQLDASVSGVHAALHPYDALFCVDDTAFTAGGSAGTDLAGSRFPVPMEVRRDEHAIIRSSRPGSAGLLSPGSVLGLCGFHLNVSQELIQTCSDGRINPRDPAFNGLS
ncbi:uncharacterized protein tmem174 [Cololabis saira]|uniref:uncharacterized protein tmem174 n=1 Tax=Cololabis saira TaxID=129043 RepID=UPI002AD1F638|nr:uncharacterized protein tmem174 [Cololabis saira]